MRGDGGGQVIPPPADKPGVWTGRGPLRSLIAAIGASATVALLCAAGAQGAPPPKIGGCPLFPAFEGSPTARSAASQRAWNQDVSKAPVDSRSSAYVNRITALGGNQVVHPDFGGHGAYGIPYTTVGPSQPRVPVKVTGYPDESDFGPAPIPANAPVEGGSDRHVLVVQRQRCDLFELFGAHYAGGQDHRWTASSTARFDLAAGRLRHDGWTSADAAGLPILPGLVRPGEVESGQVRHAIRVTFAETRRAYIHPATHHASEHCDSRLPPMGLRLRLSSGYFQHNLDRFPAGSQSRVIFKALHHYGIINADNGGTGANWFITGARSVRWKDGDLNRLKTVPGSAFVVVKSQASIKTPC